MLDVIQDRRQTVLVDRAVDIGEIKKERRRRGRPSRSAEAAQPFMIRLTDAEKKRISAAARVERKNVADYCRDVLLTESEDLLEEDESIIIKK